MYNLVHSLSKLSSIKHDFPKGALFTRFRGHLEAKGHLAEPPQVKGIAADDPVERYWRCRRILLSS
jgi:hypothetical protein